MQIEVLDDPAAAVAERLAAATGHVALTGGSSPRPAYEHAAALRTDWTEVTFWWGDERCVPPEDDRSNYKLAKDSLLDRVTVGDVHRIEGELGRQEAAARYDAALESIERFDLVLLGLGPDGHVASLFPNQPSLGERERRAVGVEAKLDPFVDRVTMTLPVLGDARLVVFLVTGESKADAVRRAFDGEPSAATPGSLVRGEETVVVLDHAAAALLRQ